MVIVWILPEIGLKLLNKTELSMREKEKSHVTNLVQANRLLDHTAWAFMSLIMLVTVCAPLNCGGFMKEEKQKAPNCLKKLRWSAVQHAKLLNASALSKHREFKTISPTHAHMMISWLLNTICPFTYR